MDADLGPDLGLLLGTAAERIQVRLGRALAELDLTARQFCVLAQAADGDRTQGQIAEFSLLDKTTMVVTLDALEAAGLAGRTPCSRDRRVRLVHTTEEGDRVLEKATSVVRAVYDEVLGALPAAQRDALVEGLGALIDVGGPLQATPAEPRPRRSSRSR